MDIERIFEGDRPVPGLRPSGRVLPTSLVASTEPVQEASNVLAVSSAKQAVQGHHEDIEGSPTQLSASEPIRPGPQLIIAHDPLNQHSERVRLLRTEILLRHSAQHGAVAFAVVGPGAGDGRSQLAAELALAFAQLGRSTLLMDADMRHPRQHALFGTTLCDGLAQAIVWAEPPPLHHVAGYATLSLMTAGISTPNPIELLSDGRFESLMHSLRHAFEFIIVDTPRCSDYADGLVISAVVGQVLTVYRAKHTPYKAAREMLRQLVSARAEILGGALNHF